MLFYRPQPLYAVILVQDHNRGNAILLELCHLKLVHKTLFIALTVHKNRVAKYAILLELCHLKLVHKTLFIALTVHKKPRSQISKEIALLMHKD
jgi:hypothetical protein